MQHATRFTWLTLQATAECQQVRGHYLEHMTKLYEENVHTAKHPSHKWLQTFV